MKVGEIWKPKKIKLLQEKEFNSWYKEAYDLGKIKITKIRDSDEYDYAHNTQFIEFVYLLSKINSWDTLSRREFLLMYEKDYNENR